MGFECLTMEETFVVTYVVAVFVAVIIAIPVCLLLKKGW